MSVNRWRCFLVLLLTLAWATTTSAQIRSATITGAVTDPTKAVVPGATVIVTNQDTNSRSELVTNEAGLFTATYLPAGTRVIASRAACYVLRATCYGAACSCRYYVLRARRAIRHSPQHEHVARST